MYSQRHTPASAPGRLQTCRRCGADSALPGTAPTWKIGKLSCSATPSQRFSSASPTACADARSEPAAGPASTLVARQAILSAAPRLLLLLPNACCTPSKPEQRLPRCPEGVWGDTEGCVSPHALENGLEFVVDPTTGLAVERWLAWLREPRQLVCVDMPQARHTNARSKCLRALRQGRRTVSATVDQRTRVHDQSGPQNRTCRRETKHNEYLKSF
jgi:hypothetical protein